jgi:hypothetical protein
LSLPPSTELDFSKAIKGSGTASCLGTSSVAAMSIRAAGGAAKRAVVKIDAVSDVV